MKKILPGLVNSRGGTQISMGRVLLLLTFTVQMLYWIAPFALKQDMPPYPEGLQAVLNSLLIYEGYKKGRFTMDTYLRNEKKKPEESS